MKQLTNLAAVLLLAGVTATACGSDEGDTEAGSTPTTAAASSDSISPSSTPASAPSDPSSGTLLMSSFDESSHTFLTTFTIRPDGSDRHDVPMPGPEGGGSWSHSGGEIAVMTERNDGRIGTAIVGPDGKVQRVLDIDDATLNLVCTVWSPDDERLACEGWDDEDETRTGIYTVRSSDGRALARLTHPGAGQADFPGDFSPDGTQFLFKRTHEEDPGPLLEVGVGGGEPAPVGDVLVEDPGRYSPDGGMILTSSGGNLLLLDRDGRVQTEIADDGAFLFGAVWSPDGSRIAFSRAVEGPFADVFTSRPDGTDRRQVTATAENEISVEWGAS